MSGAVGPSGKINHYNGTNWSTVSSGVNANLNGISGIGPFDIWFGFDNGTVMHSNGTALSAVTFPSTNSVWSFWSRNTNDVWAVGESGLLAHWNGTAWKLSNSGVTVGLNFIHGVAPDTIVAVGSSGTVMRYQP